LTFIGAGALSGGALLAAAQTAAGLAAAHLEGAAYSAGISVRQLRLYLASHAVADDTLVYVGDAGLNPAGGLFHCLLDGGKALVIERWQETDALMEDDIAFFTEEAR
jgi:hypothetical protein